MLFKTVNNNTLNNVFLNSKILNSVLTALKCKCLWITKKNMKNNVKLFNLRNTHVLDSTISDVKLITGC